MGQVDLDFKPSVPVFDANVALGRRHDRRVSSDTTEGLLNAMDRAGVGKALVYSPHAVGYDSQDGNRYLMEMIEGQPTLVPQYACNPAFDDFDTFTGQVAAAGVRSVRMAPEVHNYPFMDWVVGPWLDWLAAEGIPLWLPVSYDFVRKELEIEPWQLHETLNDHPDLTVVLSEVHYRHVSWVFPLVRALPNVSVELSRLVSTNGIPELLDAIGHERILYGSRFPDADMGPQLHNVHRCGLSDQALRAICAGNLERLLGLG